METKFGIADDILFTSLGGEIHKGKIIGIRLVNDSEQYDIGYEFGVMTVYAGAILESLKNINDIEAEGIALTDKHFTDLKNKARLKLKALKKEEKQ